ncbi:ABC transporter substrate-binding protein [Paenibacillus nanensis]|uniref:ABC transporter substrate-binding protein n=1 Tax=Paenibacillus nanensis TaxID=393251 RepID=UPI001F0BFF30|nr:ABC transporter substrate-binding protein [Paenibacillus nanensis]
MDATGKGYKKRLGGLLLLAILVSGCSSAAAGQGDGAGSLVIRDAADREVLLPGAPERIVALGNGEVDIVYALGGEVVGRPEDNGGLPEAVQDVPIVGSVHTVDLEKIAALRPDVVLGNEPINRGDIPQLEGIGAKVVLTEANSIADIRDQIKLIGQLTQREERASALTAELDAKLAEWSGRTGAERTALMVYGAPGTYLAALPNSLAGDLLETAGGVNIASQFPRMQSYPQYAQLNTERVVEAEPDVIFIMTHGNPEEVQEGFIREMEDNPAWSSLAAVREGRIHTLPADLFGTNPGTRIIDALQLLGELLEP